MIRFEEILNIIKCELICYVDEQQVQTTNSEELIKYNNHLVESITVKEGCVVLNLKPWEPRYPQDCSNEEWYKEHETTFGIPPDFF